MKKTCGSTADIISNLPCSILEKILMRLTLQDAARTSVWSRKWRYIWTKLPQLVFDDMFCRGSTTTRAATNKLMMTIYKVMLLHRGPILKLTLSLPALESCPEIDQLIFFVSNNGIQEFTLHIQKGEPYKLPSSLFSCLQLEHLDLRSCIFKPPHGFKGFTRLLSLELNEVGIADNVLSSVISNCPLLERLTVRNSTVFGYVEVDSPNLRILRFQGFFRSICFKSTSCLTEVSVYLDGSTDNVALTEGEKCNFATLLGRIPVIEFLELDYHYVKCIAASGVPKMFPVPTTLKHLKTLKLNDICFEEPDELSIVLCLIGSSPNLEEFTINAYPRETAAVVPVVELLEVQSWSNVSLNQLHRVVMEGVSGRKPELEFIKLLLAKSPKLETMLTELRSKKVAEELRTVVELTKFPRASPQAEITFKTMSYVDEV